MSLISAIFLGLGKGFVNLFLLPYHVWQWLQLETLKERMSALVQAGQSLELLFVALAAVLLLVAVGILNRRFLRATVLKLEGFNRRIGQIASWFVLLMMLQQVMIIVMGQVFRGNELLFSPFGMELSSGELQWLSGQLKFYNALLITFACAYTFIEGGHVRVDLIYGNISQRYKRWVDFMGSIFFMFPVSILMWWFAWPIATNSMFKQRPVNIFSDKFKWRDFKWESSGTAEFSWVWAFKAMIIVFAALLFIQAITFLLRNLWALLEPAENVETHPVWQDEDLVPATKQG